MKAILIEDEARNREHLARVLEKHCPEVQLVAQAEDAIAGITAIKTHQPDLIFLDIEMPGGSGFDMLESLGQVDFEVIFVTAYDSYAIRAIRFCAMDYLLKPIKILELKSAVERVHKKRRETAHNLQLQAYLQNLKLTHSAQKLALPTQEKIEMVSISEIIRCQGERNYTRFMLADGRKLLVSKALGEYEELLEEFQFLRVHQSHLVNLQHIDSFIRKDGGYLIMSNEDNVAVSRRRKENLIEALNGL